MHDIAAALVALRELFGLSQGKLGQALGLSQSALSKLESGLTELTPDLISEFTLKLGVARTFLNQEFDRCPMSATAFRKFSDVTQTQAKSIRAFGSLVSERLRACLDISGEEIDQSARQSLFTELQDDPVAMATMVREYWQAGEAPIQDLTRHIEDLGIVVVHVDLGIPRIDGLSLWPEGMSPLILLKAGAEGSRMRFTLAHELGHVLLHGGSPAGKTEKQLEAEADLFAGELLMPSAFKSELPTKADYWSFLALKKHWGASALAIIHRAKDLGVIDSEENRRLYMYVSRMGYRKAEPEPLKPEQPSLFRRLGQRALEACGGDIERFAERVYCTSSEAQSWIDGKPVQLPKPPQSEEATALS